LADFAAHRVDNGDRGAGVVNEQFLARRMRLAQADREPPDPRPIVGAETAVAVAVRMFGLVFLPEEVERHALAPQFAMYGRPIGFRTDLARGRCRRIQPCFQFDLAQPRRQRVAQSALLRPAKNLAHRRRRTADHPGNLTMASASLVRQP
jgi:hypothetical protein